MRADHEARKICNEMLTRTCRFRGQCFNFVIPAAKDGAHEPDAYPFTERLTRARGDLRMGVPVVMCWRGTGRRWSRRSRRWMPPDWQTCAGLVQAFLAITSRRAETLKARVYDGDLARIVPPDRGGSVLAAIGRGPGG
jgi:hypothetical protein